MKAPNSSRKANILVIDDEGLIQGCTSNILELVGHQVAVAGCGEEGIAWFRKGDFFAL